MSDSGGFASESARTEMRKKIMLKAMENVKENHATIYIDILFVHS